MNHLPFCAKTLAVLFAVALPLQAAERTFRLQPTSKRTIRGKSNLHWWTVETQEIDVADFSGIFPVSSETDKTVKARGNIRGSILVRSLRSSTDSWANNLNLIFSQLKG